MKLIIQIPCFNEAEILPLTLASLSRSVREIAECEVVVIDDGSTDGTSLVAGAFRVDEIVSLGVHKGLAAAFTTGLSTCLHRGADMIVNVDADCPDSARDIPRLIEPIVRGDADMVIGARDLDTCPYLTRGKRLLHRFGRRVISTLISQPVPDPTSGFRAYSRAAALRLHIASRHSYVLESIIQAPRKGIRLAHVPIDSHRPMRPSRLIQSTPQYIARSALTVLRSSLRYAPLPFLFSLAGVLVLVSAVLLAWMGKTDWSGAAQLITLPIGYVHVLRWRCGGRAPIRGPEKSPSSNVTALALRQAPDRNVNGLTDGS